MAKVDGINVVDSGAMAVDTVTSAHKRGKDVEIKAGAPITAFVDQDVELAVTP